MKNPFCGTLISTVAAVFLSMPVSSVQAGDSMDTLEAYDWSGVYGGGQLGFYLDGSVTATQTKGVAHYFIRGQPYSADFSQWKGFVGLHAGMQMQSGAFVYGVQVDGNYLEDLSWSAAGPYDTNNFETVIDGGTITFTGKVGLSFENALIYGRAGLAIASVNLSVSEPNFPGHFGSGTEHQHHKGFTAGGGFQYAATENIIVGIEYNYVDLDSRNYTINDNTSIGASEIVNVNPNGIHSIMGKV